MYSLINAEEQNKKYPETFHIPSREMVEAIKVGDIVKLGFEENEFVERMWVVVTAIEKGHMDFIGRLDNDPFEHKSVKCGDLVPFKAENIFNVW